MNTHYDIVIVGGGMVGAMLACALGDSDYQIAVVEAFDPPAFSPDQKYDLRVSALSIASQNMLQAVGAWDNIANMRACPYSRMLVWDHEGDGETLFDSAEIAEPVLGHIVENRVTQLALLQRMQQFSNIDYLCPHKIVGLDEQRAHILVQLEDGQQLTSQLVVGADGANSQVKALSGIKTQGKDYEQHALVATIETELPQQDITWQRFVPTGPEAFLPLLGHQASMVWYHTADEVQRLLSLSDESFAESMHVSFPERLGGITRVIERGSFPLRKRHAERYTQGRVVLVGDAAHTIHPLAGQGVNLGFMDAATLAETLLVKGKTVSDPGSKLLLRRYERRRKAPNLLMQSSMSAIYHTFRPQPKPIVLARNLALNISNKVTPIRNFTMRYAMGLAGDRPKLARGLNLHDQ